MVSPVWLRYYLFSLVLNTRPSTVNHLFSIFVAFLIVCLFLLLQTASRGPVLCTYWASCKWSTLQPSWSSYARRKRCWALLHATWYVFLVSFYGTFWLFSTNCLFSMHSEKKEMWKRHFLFEHRRYYLGLDIYKNVLKAVWNTGGFTFDICVYLSRIGSGFSVNNAIICLIVLITPVEVSKSIKVYQSKCIAKMVYTF